MKNIFRCEWIYLMSRPWKELERDIRSHLFVMLKHLVKVYYYHDYSKYIHVWCDSIKKGFEDIGKIVPKNKYPSKEKLYKFIVEDWGDGDIDKRHRDIIEDLNASYDEVPPIENIDSDGFMKFFLSYCDYLCTILSENGGITTFKVENFVKNYFSISS